jgi:hypothetical protein
MRFLLIIRHGNKRGKVVASDLLTARHAARFWRLAGFGVRVVDRWS